MNVSRWVGHAQRTMWAMAKGTIYNNVCVDGVGVEGGSGSMEMGMGWRVEMLDCFSTGSHFLRSSN